MSRQATPEPLERMKSVLQNKPFRPHPVLISGHLQTVVGSRQRRAFKWGWKRSQVDTLELTGGARIQVRRVVTRQDAPTLLVVHGMAGSSDSGYMLGLSHKAFARGWNALLPDLYDRNPGTPRPRVFHAGSSADLLEVIQAASARFGLEGLYLAGVSMGGNVLLRLLGEADETLRGQVRGAAVISPLVDLNASWSVFDRRSNWLYRRYYLNRLCLITRQQSERSRLSIDLSRLNSIRTIREFDEVVTVPLAGFASVWDYYSQASSARLMNRILVPTLLLHSQDDPLLPWKPLQRACEGNPRLLLELCRRGGHVAFLEREQRDLDRSWAENRAIDFFDLCRG